MSFVILFLLYLITCQLPSSLLGQSAPQTGIEPVNSSIADGLTAEASFFPPYTQEKKGKIHLKRHILCRREHSKLCLLHSPHGRCCKKHCVDVSIDLNNCGACGRKCKQGMRCCDGVCVNIWNDIHHCGKCHNACIPDESCDFGLCSYG